MTDLKHILIPAAMCAAMCVVPGRWASAQTFTVEQVVDAARDGQCSELLRDSADLDTDSDSTIESELIDAHLARCLLDEGAFDDAVEAIERLDQSLAQSGHEIDDDLRWLAEARARVQLIAGDTIGATEAFRELVRLADGGSVGQETRARRLYYLALSLEAGGSLDEARDTYRRLRSAYPASPYIVRAAPILMDDVISPDARLEIAETALDGRNYPLAERMFTLIACPSLEGHAFDYNDAYVDMSGCDPTEVADSDDRTRYEAAYQLGFMLYRYRREHVERALPWLQALSDTRGRRRADALYTHARALMRMENYTDAAIVWLDFAERYPDDRRVHEAYYFAGWLPFDHDDHVASIPGLSHYLEAYPDGARNEAARWALGWAYYRDDDCEEAIDLWRPLERTYEWRDQSRYWQAVCYQAIDETEVANELWTDLRDDPFTYYGILAARRLGLPLIPDLEQRPNPAATDLIFDASSARVLATARRGLIAESHLIARYDATAAAPSADDDVASEVWQMWVEADRHDWSRWHRQFRRLEDDMPSDVDELQAWQLAHPIFYDQVVEEAAEREGIPTSLIWAIMRRESSYDPDALSHSDAMGLMQVIPQTAERIAERLDDRYVDGMLFEPYNAIVYGAWYLGQLQAKFQGQTALAIGAYNAGPIAMESWAGRNAGLRFDEFVEEIAYQGARTYIKNVLETMVRYEVAWGDEATLNDPTLGGLFPLTVEGDYGDQVDF